MELSKDEFALMQNELIAAKDALFDANAREKRIMQELANTHDAHRVELDRLNGELSTLRKAQGKADKKEVKTAKKATSKAANLMNAVMFRATGKAREAKKSVQEENELLREKIAEQNVQLSKLKASLRRATAGTTPVSNHDATQDDNDPQTILHRLETILAAQPTSEGKAEGHGEEGREGGDGEDEGAKAEAASDVATTLAQVRELLETLRTDGVQASTHIALVDSRHEAKVREELTTELEELRARATSEATEADSLRTEANSLKVQLDAVKVASKSRIDELQSQLDSSASVAQTRLDALTDELAASHERVEQLLADKAAADEAAIGEASAKEDWVAQTQRLAKHIADLQAERSIEKGEMETAMQGLHDEIAALKLKNEDAEKKHSEELTNVKQELGASSEATAAELEEEVTTLRGEVNDLKKTVLAEKEEVSVLSASLDARRDELQAALEESLASQDTIKELQATETKLKENHEKIETQLRSDLEEKVTELRLFKESSAAEIEQLKTAKTEAESALASYETKAAESAQEAEGKVKELQSEIESLNEQISILQTEVDDQQAQVKITERKHNHLVKELKTELQRVKTLREREQAAAANGAGGEGGAGATAAASLPIGEADGVSPTTILEENAVLAKRVGDLQAENFRQEEEVTAMKDIIATLEQDLQSKETVMQQQGKVIDDLYKKYDPDGTNSKKGKKGKKGKEEANTVPMPPTEDSTAYERLQHDYAVLGDEVARLMKENDELRNAAS